MVIPLGTDRPLRRPTLVNYAIIAVNVAVYFAMLVLAQQGGGETGDRLYGALWLSRADLEPWRFVTYAFLHAGPMHLLGNMLFLWVFGANVEDRFGRPGYLLFYLAGGALAGAAHVGFEGSPVVGASGAIAAVTGAYLVLFPRTQVKIIFMFFGLFMIPAAWFIGFAIAKDLFWLAHAKQAVIDGVPVHDSVARLAHLGGYGFGTTVALVLLWTRVLGREPYDLFTIGRQAYRRRQMREAALSAAGKGPRRDPAKPARETPEEAARSAAVAEARAGVAALISKGDLEGAARAYKDLADRHADLRGAATLSRRNLLDLANHYFAQRDYSAALFAYERFLESYERDAEAPRVRLMVGLISARYLNDPVRAKQALIGLAERLHEPGERAHAAELLEELG